MNGSNMDSGGLKTRPILKGLNMNSGGLKTHRILEGSNKNSGLAISRQAIHQMNGNIYFDTRKNVGTTFTIELPLAQ